MRRVIIGLAIGWVLAKSITCGFTEAAQNLPANLKSKLKRHHSSSKFEVPPAIPTTADIKEPDLGQMAELGFEVKEF